MAHEAACTVRPQYAGRYGTNGVVAGVVAGTPGMDADLVGRDRVEDARPTDLDGEAGGELTHLMKVEARRERRHRCRAHFAWVHWRAGTRRLGSCPLGRCLSFNSTNGVLLDSNSLRRRSTASDIPTPIN